MKYRLVVSEVVDLDLQDYYDYIVSKEKSEGPAKRWYSDIRRAINEVRDYPEKHLATPEFAEGQLDVRESHRHSHRIIFSIDKPGRVDYVLRVYHMSRKPLNPKDVDGA